MRAVHMPAAGEQPVFADAPTPAVSEGAVLIRARAAGLNPPDNAVPAGMFAEVMPHEYALILGHDAAGVVEVVGADVDHVAVGDAVIGNLPLVLPLRHGTLAELALLPADSVIPIPDGLEKAGAGLARSATALLRTPPGRPS